MRESTFLPQPIAISSSTTYITSPHLLPPSLFPLHTPSTSFHHFSTPFHLLLHTPSTSSTPLPPSSLSTPLHYLVPPTLTEVPPGTAASHTILVGGTGRGFSTPAMALPKSQVVVGPKVQGTGGGAGVPVGGGTLVS